MRNTLDETVAQEQTESYLSSLSSNEFPAKKEDFEKRRQER